ncbi:MAG: ABC transporter ATP-binding protein [Clostridia bacterium]|nr:ABC transporter ATP-binding protein [Clostridia bacterium]
MHKLLRYLNKKQIFSCIAVIVLLFIQANGELALPDYMSKIVSEGIGQNNLDNIYKYGAIMLLISLMITACAIMVGFLAARTAAQLSRTLRIKIFSKVESFSNTEFDKFSTASLITRSTNDIQQIQMFFVMLLRMIFFAPVMGAGGIVRAITKSREMPQMTVIIIIGVITLLVMLFTLLKLTIPKFKIIQKLIDRLNLVTREQLTGLMVIRAFNTEAHERERFDDANTVLTNNNLSVFRTMALMHPIMSLIMNGVSVAVIWVGAYLISDVTDLANVMAFMQYAMHIIMSFLFISMAFMQWPRASVSTERIREIIETEIIVKDPENPVSSEDFGKTGVIEFKNVCFKYTGADEYTLENISFTAKPGETTAFIGSTGSGKSTLINLVPRFYDVSEGSITIDGIDIRNVTQKDLRNIIGYIPQKGILFTGDINSNLKYSDENAQNEDILKAAEVAQALDFIEKMPDKLNSEIAQGGSNVSGGQKQRLSIARALVKKPQIYIFDDSFSTLDFKTDAKLRKALKEYTQNATVLIVAQRINTIMNAEQIVVLDEGKVVGIGTHKQLLKECEVYRDIALSQLSKEELQ